MDAVRAGRRRARDAGRAGDGGRDATWTRAIDVKATSLVNVQMLKGENVTVNGHEIPVVYARLKT
jgi:hypothetical protein